jgi:hypothetical protein
MGEWNMKIKYIIICSLVLSIIAGCSIQKNIAVRENSTNKKAIKTIRKK